YTKRFAFYVGRRCRSAPIRDIAKELRLDWHTVKELDKQYMRAQLAKAGTPGPTVIGIDEISVRKGHDYRIVVSDLVRQRPIWFGGSDRSEASMAQCYQWLGEKKCERIRLAVMDMWKPFSQRHQCSRAVSRNPVRQVPHHSPPGRSPRSSAKERVRAPVGKATPLHQGAKIHAAVAQGEPHAGGPTGIEDFVARQQTAEHRLCS